MLVGGSHYSAYEDIPWINDLARLLPQYVQRKARIIGCCFGAQVSCWQHLHPLQQSLHARVRAKAAIAWSTHSWRPLHHPPTMPCLSL